MNRLIQITVGTISLCPMLVGTPASAAIHAASEAKIVQLHIESGEPFLFFDKPINNEGMCQKNDVIAISSATSNFAATLSIALAAQAAGKRVHVWTDGCSWAPWGTVPKLYAMSILT
jgi:hypothetical protein